MTTLVAICALYLSFRKDGGRSVQMPCSVEVLDDLRKETCVQLHERLFNNDHVASLPKD